MSEQKKCAIEITADIVVSLINTEKLNVPGAGTVDKAIQTAESINVLFNSIHENISQKLKD